VRSSSSESHDRILSAAIDLLRKYGPERVTVLDVAAGAGMSHPNVYRHFKSKKALQEAVMEVWFRQVLEPLGHIAQSAAPVEQRLEKWMVRASNLRQKSYVDDPELFAMYRLLAQENRPVIQQFQLAVHEQVLKVLKDGVKSKTYRIRQVSAAAKTILEAMVGFVHPDRVVKFAGEPRAGDVRRMFRLLNAGLKAGVL
jgi:AcrR family transcriptional regulator